ncbi:MAG: tetratricopeptide repeat protein [Lutibacter sp.]|nr:tetratricopeptide repeat protein [Lutibacter sp.]
MNLRSFFKQCHDKEVFKMLSIYVVSSWVLLQVLALVWKPLGLPEKTITYLILLLLISFPFYILYVWKAIVIPLENEIIDLDDIEKKKKAAFKKGYFSSLGVISVINLVAVLLIINNNFTKTIALPKVKQSDKIAVLKFGNNTGDAAYDIISKMTADWIMHGITENKAGQVISNEVVDEYASALKIKNTKGDVNSLVKEYLMPSKIISGNFYLKNNKLLFQSTVKDGNKDETLIAFETSECGTNDALKCIDELKEQILGFLMTEGQKREMLQEKPPKYDAYKYVLEAKITDESEKHIDLLNKAIQADPGYFEPKVLRVAYYYNYGNYKKADSLLKAIEPDSKKNIRQLNLLNSYQALLAGNNKKVYQTILQEYAIAPFDLKSNKSAMVVALQFVNRPEAVEPIFNAIKMDSMDIQNCQDCIIRIYVKALAYVELKKYDAVIQLLEPFVGTVESPFLKKPLIASYIRAKNDIKIDVLLNKFQLLNKLETYQDLCLFIAKEYLLMGNTDKANEYFNKIINSPKNTSEKTMLAEAFYYKNDFAEAEKIWKELHAQNKENIDFLAKLAFCNLKMNNEKQAEKYLKNLEVLRDRFQFGSIDYAFAQYYAASDNKTEMEKYLMKAVAGGFLFTSQTFQNDPHFIKYKDAPSFKNILNYWH